MGRYIEVDVENTYEYRGYNVESLDEVANTLNYNLRMASDPKSYVTDVEEIMKLAKSLAQSFVASNHPVPGSRHQSTRRLYDSINYDMEPSNGGTGARLYANAADKYGRKYAGHIEYGFTDKSGIPHGPWPFLRPAMRIAAEASTGSLADHMSEITLYGGAFSHHGELKFGRKNLYSQMTQSGGRRNVISQTRKGYGATSKGKSWSNAKNGIGYRSGASVANRADEYDYAWGVL